MKKKKRQPQIGLTADQERVLRLRVAGHTMAEIAEIMELSPMAAGRLARQGYRELGYHFVKGSKKVQMVKLELERRDRSMDDPMF